MEYRFKQLVLIFFTYLSIFPAVWSNTSLPIVPKPVQETISDKQVFMQEKWGVYIPSQFDIHGEYLSSIFNELGIEIVTSGKDKAQVIVNDDKKMSENAEAYHLEVTGKGKISISASSKNGVLYAFQTLRQIVQVDNNTVTLPVCKIADEPAFSWRAFMLDESRHFQGMETVKRLLDEMARLKMNTFHWHLVDDPGWRLEIKKYPELTKTGSKRDYSHRDIIPEKWSETFPDRKMFYTQTEIREIVQYAAHRGIKIVPEIEVPGHASASIAAYPWLGASSSKEGKGIWGDLYNVTDPKVEAFLHDVLDEVIELFPSKIIHIGGDEADHSHWHHNPQIVEFMKENNIPTFSDLQVWSINRFSKYLASKGIKMMGWNEITGDNIRNEAHIQESLSEKLAEGTIVHFWDGDIHLVNKSIEKGYDVVNSNRHFTYLDYPYEVIPLEKAYSFDPIPERLEKSKESKILGTGCQMWGEFTPNLTRLYYQTFPRIAAYAECGWTKAANKDYPDFCRRVKNTERRWRKLGYFNQQPSFSKQDDTFTLWQLPSQINTIGNSYVIRTDNNKIIVMDGGVKEEENYLRGFLAGLGNVVDYWFVTHPHGDHIGALTKILENPKGITIREICQSSFSDNLLEKEPGSKEHAIQYYETFKKSGIKSTEASPGMVFTFGNTTIKILGIKNEEITGNNPYNNSSMVIRVSDPVKSVLFLADTGKESGDKLLDGPFKNELDCDYIQLAHHGQQGVSMDFYRRVKFRACLWSTPTWVYNNDTGNGFNTGHLKTMETRDTMDELKITEQYFSFAGLTKIE
ncbi:MAG: family 20 glycosylhydrolase [Tannerella sp.]|jgi:N-acetyl-beta-hexosaminidase|nr:family 20 glycosylhydrolase [Tannerella sp.]